MNVIALLWFTKKKNRGKATEVLRDKKCGSFLGLNNVQNIHVLHEILI